MRVLVIGWFKENIGDLAYKLAFKHLFPQCDFTFSDRYIEGDWQAVIIGGGNIINLGLVNQVKHIKNKYAISVDMNESNKDLFKDFKDYRIRNIETHEKYMPDIAFCLKGNVLNGANLIKKIFKNHDLYSKVGIVVLNSHVLYPGNQEYFARDFLTFQKFAQDLASTLDETCASFLFLPMCTSMPFDDRIANSWVASRCKYWKKHMVSYEPLSVEDTIDIISASDFMISSRLHSTIFATNFGIPFADITHHDKNLSFLKTIGQEKRSVSYWDFNKFKFKEILNDLIQNKSEHSRELEYISKEKYQILKEKSNEIHFY